MRAAHLQSAPFDWNCSILDVELTRDIGGRHCGIGVTVERTEEDVSRRLINQDVLAWPIFGRDEQQTDARDITLFAHTDDEANLPPSALGSTALVPASCHVLTERSVSFWLTVPARWTTYVCGRPRRMAVPGRRQSAADGGV